MTSDDDILEWFHERAAIIEIDGKRDRVTANKLAGICVRKQFGSVPDCVMEVIVNSEK